MNFTKCVTYVSAHPLPLSPVYTGGGLGRGDIISYAACIDIPSPWPSPEGRGNFLFVLWQLEFMSGI